MAIISTLQGLGKGTMAEFENLFIFKPDVRCFEQFRSGGSRSHWEEFGCVEEAKRVQQAFSGDHADDAQWDPSAHASHRTVGASFASESAAATICTEWMQYSTREGFSGRVVAEVQLIVWNLIFCSLMNTAWFQWGLWTNMDKDHSILFGAVRRWVC